MRSHGPTPRADCSRCRRSGRLSHAALAAATLVGAVAGGVAIERGVRSTAPLLSAVHVDRVVMPLCNCPRGTAHFQFRLARRTRLSVEVLTAGGRVAARVVRNRLAGPGVVRLAWRGRTLLGRALPDGSYRPAIVMPLLGRTIRLRARITLVDGPLAASVLGR